MPDSQSDHRSRHTDRKAAKAMSSLDVKAEDEPSAPKKEVDTKALAEAMKYLSVGQDSTAATAKKATEGSKKKEEVQKAPPIKVDQADVSLVAEACDLSKGKATELLRAHGADAVKALGAWVEAGA